MTLGAYLCFELDDWQQGLVHLAASGLEELSEIAQLDLDSQTNLEDTESVGDRWWDLKPTARFSTYKDQLKARAAYWYALAIGDKTGLARKKLEKRIEEAGFVLDENEMVLKSATPRLVVAPFDEKQAKAHQTAWANHLDIPVAMANSMGMKFVLIPPGEFMMATLVQGGTEGIIGSNQFTVPTKISVPFYFAIHEVTQEQYKQLINQSPASPAKFVGPDNPVNMENWGDANGFCKKLSALPAESGNSRSYRLPTEAEWEYAARAGQRSDLAPAETIRDYGQYAWYQENAGGTTHPVGTRKPNQWGLFDTQGNLAEWCQEKTNRGSKFGTPPGRVSMRDPDRRSGERYRHKGFRVVLAILDQILQKAAQRSKLAEGRSIATSPSKTSPQANSREARSVFPGWQQFAVHQRRAATGCIPTGYEMLLRAAKVERNRLRQVSG